MGLLTAIRKLRYPVSTDAFNPPLHLQQLAGDVDAHLSPSVADEAALPASGNWPGRAIWVLSLKEFRVWSGTLWDQPGGVTINATVDSWMTMEAGWTLNSAQASWTPTTVTLRLDVTKKTPAISSVSDGNIPNDIICTIKPTFATFRPATQSAFATTSTGPSANAYMNTTGDLQLSALSPGVGLAIGAAVVVAGTYLRKLA